MTEKLTDKQARLQKKIKTLQDDLDRVDVRIKNRDRKRQTGLKHVVGEAMLARAKRDPSFHKRLRDVLDQDLKRPHDRAIFKERFPPVPEDENPPKE